jgi:hypothetical protein
VPETTIAAEGEEVSASLVGEAADGQVPEAVARYEPPARLDLPDAIVALTPRSSMVTDPTMSEPSVSSP